MANFYGFYPSGGGGGGGGSGTGFTQTGTISLVSGTATVANTSVSAGSVFFLTNNAISGIQGALSIGTVTPGVSFVINSSSASDNSKIAWGFL